MSFFDTVGAMVGSFPGASVANVIGINNDIDTGTVPEDITCQGGSYTFLAAASALEVVSDSANDTAAGTGAQTVSMTLLDASLNQVATITVSLNGTTPVAIPGGAIYLRCNNLICGDGGSGEFNAGLILLRVAGAGATIACISPGKGRAQQAIYTVPAGRSALSFHNKVSMIRATAAGLATVELRTRRPGGVWVCRNTIQVTTDNWDVSNPFMPPLIAEKNDIRFVCTEVSNNNTSIQAVLQMLIIDPLVCRLPTPSRVI